MAQFGFLLRRNRRFSPLLDLTRLATFSLSSSSPSSMASKSLFSSSSSRSPSHSSRFPNDSGGRHSQPLFRYSSLVHFSLNKQPFNTSSMFETRDDDTIGNEKGTEPPLISKAETVLKENSKRREKIANAVAQFAQEYRRASEEDHRRFLLHLVDNFGVSQPEVSQNATSLLNVLVAQQDNINGSVSQRKLVRHLDKLRQSLIPAYDRLFAAVGALDDGIKLVVDLRAQLLAMIASASSSTTTTVSHSKAESSSAITSTTSSSAAAAFTVDDATLVRLRDLDRSLKELLSSWFSVGLLKLETVDWKSSCDLLQKVSEYERVHPVRSWTDLKQRVGPYRRCFIFTHSSMPRDPVMVLHTHLSDSISRSIDEIIRRPNRLALPDHAPLGASVDIPPDESPFTKSSVSNDEDPSNIQAAIFYSINNTQSGLNGVDLGHYLIKNAVKALQREFPHLQVFSTLSPIKGFKQWFMTKLSREVKYFTHRIPGNPKPATSTADDSAIEDLERLFTDAELKAMMTELMSAGYSPEPYQLMLFTHKLHVFLSTNKWYQNQAFVKVLELPLKRLCVHYLYVEKRRGYALNPIANFHLRNGSTLWRLNWLADVSPKGLEDAFGLMVNYRYFPDKTEENNRRYAEEKFIDISDDVLKILASSA